MQLSLAAAPSALPSVLATLDIACDDEPRACGWFESSLELSRCLAVVEHAAFDTLAADLPLAWQLAPWL